MLIIFKILIKKTSHLYKMKKETYWLVCRKYTKNINPKRVRNRQNRSMIQSDCVICDSKKSRFIKAQ